MQTYLSLPEPSDLKSLLNGLDLQIGKSQKEHSRRLYLDTFDGRLFGSDWSLYQKEGQLVLQRGHEDEPILCAAKPPIAAEALPETTAAKALRKVIKNRVLLPQLELRLHMVRTPLVDEERKSHLYLEEITLDAKGYAPVSLLAITPLRGYEKSADRVAKVLQKAGADSAVWPVEGWLGQSLAPWPVAPLITTQMEGLEALRVLCLHQLAVMELNEAGVIDGLDVEFLHDFRVALRRMRSLLGRLKGVLSEETHATFARELSQLGRQSGRVRDLDVWLEQLTDQSAALPLELRSGLAPLISYVQSEQKRAARALIKTLQSEPYHTLKKGWHKLLTTPLATQLGPQAKEPVGYLATVQLHKRIRRVLKDGEAIDAQSPDEKLHTLRIDCKKVRYLLEFFGHLFDSRTMKQMVSQLKKLQSTLGLFQDITTQRANLHHALEMLKTQHKLTPECLMATGALLSHLQQQHDKLRKRFFVEFGRFNDPGVAQAALLDLKARKEAYESDRDL